MAGRKTNGPYRWRIVSLKNEDTLNEECLEIGAWVGVQNFKGRNFMPDSADAELCISLDNSWWFRSARVHFLRSRDIQRLNFFFYILGLLDTFLDCFLIPKTSLARKGCVQACLEIVVTQGIFLTQIEKVCTQSKSAYHVLTYSRS